MCKEIRSRMSREHNSLVCKNNTNHYQVEFVLIYRQPQRGFWSLGWRGWGGGGGCSLGEQSPSLCDQLIMAIAVRLAISRSLEGRLIAVLLTNNLPTLLRLVPFCFFIRESLPRPDMIFDRLRYMVCEIPFKQELTTQINSNKNSNRVLCWTWDCMEFTFHVVKF